MEVLDATNRQTSFKDRRKNEEEINQRPKRLRKETPAIPSEILTETPSTAILVEETVNFNVNLLATQNHNEKTSNYLAIKLSRLKDKETRFESHKDFLTCCINKGLVPKGLELLNQIITKSNSKPLRPKFKVIT